MASNITDYYRVLELASNASDDDIKRSYKKLAVKYHPDKTSDTSYHELFIKIQEAYETLKDPQKRRKYDIEHRKPNYNSYKSYTTSTHTSTSTSNSTSKPGRTPGYYGFYQHFYRSYQNPDIAEKQKQAQEEKLKKDRENQAAKAAKLAKEKIEEQLRKDREIRIKKERELEKQREHEKYKEKENERETENTHYNERKRDAYRKEWENTFSHFAQEDDVLDHYFFERRRAQERATDKPLSDLIHDGNPLNNQTPHHRQTPDTGSLGQHGHDSNDPIVLDDDDGMEQKYRKLTGATSNTQPSANSLTSSNNMGSNHDSDSDDDEFVSVLHGSLDDIEDDAANSNLKDVEQLFNARMNLRPRQEPSRLSKSRHSVSPSRNKPVAPNMSYVRHDSVSHEYAASKRPKTTGTFGFDNLKDQLGADIGNVDFTEVLESLPSDASNDKTRKISDDITSKIKAKRPKIAEYTDGTSKAETLHIPINKNSVKGHSMPSNVPKKTLTMLDLHASPTIHNYAPPIPPEALLSKKLTEEVWMRYVSSIRNYQSDFLNYKKHIVQYQVERSKKDEEYFELINSSSSCFEVYQQCLERDFKVIQEYTELLRVFTSIMDVYKQNCNWVKMSNS